MLLRVRSIMGLMLTLCMVLALPATARAFTIQEVTSPGGIKAWLVEEKAIPLLAMNFSFGGGASKKKKKLTKKKPAPKKDADASEAPPAAKRAKAGT